MECSEDINNKHMELTSARDEQGYGRHKARWLDGGVGYGRSFPIRWTRGSINYCHCQ